MVKAAHQPGQTHHLVLAQGARDLRGGGEGRGERGACGCSTGGKEGTKEGRRPCKGGCQERAGGGRGGTGRAHVRSGCHNTSWTSCERHPYKPSSRAGRFLRMPLAASTTFSIRRAQPRRHDQHRSHHRPPPQTHTMSMVHTLCPHLCGLLLYWLRGRLVSQQYCRGRRLI